MNERQSFLSIPIVGFLLTTLLGFLLTFVLITRWLWPVQWSDASPRNLSPEAQVSYLRMVIGSFALRPDAELAVQRYHDLGPYAETTLANVQLDPGYLNPADVAAFSAVVGVSGPVPAAPPPPVNQVWVLLGWLFGILFIVLLLYFLYAYWRGRQAEREVQAYTMEDEHDFQPAPWETSTVTGVEEDTQIAIEEVDEPVLETAEEETVSASDELGDMPEAGPGAAGMLGAGMLGAGMLGAAALAADHAEEEAELEEEQLAAPPADATEEEVLPDWLAEFDFSGEEDTAGGGMADAALGAGLVGAGLAAAALSGEDEAEETPPAEPALEDELDVQAAGMDMELPDWLAEFEAEAEEEVPELAEAPQPLEEIAKFRNSLEFVEGIGPAYATRLAEIGIDTPLALLEVGATPRGRDRIVEQTGISQKLVLKWVNQVDMYRIKGIGSEYAELLEVSGVDTVVELATRNPEHLFEKMGEVNAEKNLVRQLPTQMQVTDWIKQAKILPRMIHY